jgi:hypothetical protein
MTAMQVDDVLLAAEGSVYARFVRHMLFHIYAQADLITSIKKNDLRGAQEVVFNGFVITQERDLEPKMELPGERRQTQGVAIQVQDSTAGKLRDLVQRWRREYDWANTSRLVGYFSWFTQYNNFAQQSL